jgi:shikimate 5-dehydrogenase
MQNVKASELTPATRPTFYFIGVTTGKSSIMNVFPRWAQHLGLGDVPIRGVDCKPHDDPAVYRHIVEFLKNDKYSLGALVTTHKIDLLKAARNLFDELDPYAQVLGEISSISKKGSRLAGHAKDALTSGLAIEAFVNPNYWLEMGAELCLLGAGGSSRALALYLMRQPEGYGRPSRIHITNRSLGNLQSTREVLKTARQTIPIEYTHTPKPEDNDLVLRLLKPGSLVANATGLGKDAPGSPITNAAEFPMNGMAWDFNYRGDLVFLEQARAQQKVRNLKIEDGWVYFLHGWTRVIAEVFHINIPFAGPAFQALSEIAASTRK